MDNSVLIFILLCMSKNNYIKCFIIERNPHFMCCLYSILFVSSGAGFGVFMNVSFWETSANTALWDWMAPGTR